MNEFFRRLIRSKRLATESVLASLFVNVLFLASPIYVIQILSRYIGYGFDGTLYTLTAGMLMALCLLMGFTVVRTRMCAAISIEPDQRLQAAVLEAVSSVKGAAVERIPQAHLLEIIAAPQIVQKAYDSSRIASVLDMPFFLLFLCAIFFLSPMLALITLLAAAASIVAGLVAVSSARRSEMALREETMRHRASVNSAIQGGEAVRAFSGQGYLRNLWDKQVATLSRLRDDMVVTKSRSTALLQGISMLLRVSVYAVGAKEVVMGDMTVGSLIGISILSSKALQISSGFMQTYKLMGKAEVAMRMINEFLLLPRESTSGTALKKFSGRMEFKDVSMAFQDATGPLFESLNCIIEPGAVVGVLGSNGAGKTTLCKLLAGLLEPVRGQILADGVEIRQLSSHWWRKQVTYLPQEPTFLNGTLRDNIIMGAPDTAPDTLNRIIKETDLRRFFDSSTMGIETEIIDGGRSLPLGIRKRLALARAMAIQGQLVILDEPTEGLDAEGRDAVFRILNRLSRERKTVVIVSRDTDLLKGFTAIIDLDSKPVPRVGNVQKRTPGTVPGEA